MKKFAAALAAALVALLGLTVLAPSAQAYPTPILTLKLSVHTPILSGGVFTATAHADIHCDTLSLTWNGQGSTVSGSTVTRTFRAPIVTKTTVITAVAVCTFTQTTGTAGHAIAATTQTLTAKANVTVIPLNSGAHGHLPNTGGPSIAWLIAGLLALLGGAAAMIVGRRRDDAGTPVS